MSRPPRGPAPLRADQEWPDGWALYFQRDSLGFTRSRHVMPDREYDYHVLDEDGTCSCGPTLDLDPSEPGLVWCHNQWWRVH